MLQYSYPSPIYYSRCKNTNYFRNSKILGVKNGSPVIPCVCLTSPNTKTVKTLICTAMLYEGSDAVDERDGHTCLYPIPADVRALNHNLEQNPGY